MGFPIIHTNFWDAVIAVPVVMILTQAIKVFSLFNLNMSQQSLWL